MPYLYSVDVSVRLGVRVEFSSETEMSEGDCDTFAASVAGDAVDESRLFAAHPFGVDSSSSDFLEHEGDVVLEDLEMNVLAIEAV